MTKHILADFIKVSGGIEKANQDPKFKANITELVNNSVNLVNLYKNMPVGSQNIRDYLNKICGNPDTIPTEVISTRLWCNYRVIEVYSKLKFVTNAVETFYTDFEQTLKSQPGMAILSKGDITSVQQQIEDFNPKKYPYTMNILDGLSVDLVNNIKKIPACMVNNMPNIEQWQAKATSKSPYIVVKCYGNKEGNVFKDLIKSKYYYINHKDNNVDPNIINVLGVLVPKRFFANASDEGLFNSTQWLDQSSFQTRASNDGSTINGNYYVSHSTAINNSNRLQSSTPSIFPNTIPITFVRDGQNYTVLEFMPQVSDIANSIKLQLTYPLAYYWVKSSSKSGFANDHSFILMRTEFDGYGYVWLNRTRLYREWQPVGDMFYYQTLMQCMTYDCRISADQLKQLVMEHDSPKPIKIGFKGTQNIMTNSDNQSVGAYYTNNKLYINDKLSF